MFVAEVIAFIESADTDTQISSQAGLALETGTCSTPDIREIIIYTNIPVAISSLSHNN